MALPTLMLSRAEGRLEIKDNPGLYWEFYCAFIVGGLVALYVTLTSSVSWVTLVVAVAVSVGSIAVGFYLLAREKASILVFDSVAGTLRVTRWTLFKRVEHSRPLIDVRHAQVETKDNIDAASLVRPTLVFTDGSTLPISMFWYKQAETSKLLVDQITEYIGR